MAIGDALGVPVEGTSRGELARHPVVGMRDTDVEIFPAGGWSESTSMALVLVDCLSSGTDIDGMFRGLVDWFRRTNYTAYNHILKIGDTVMQAIFRGLQGGATAEIGEIPTRSTTARWSGRSRWSFISSRNTASIRRAFRRR